MDRFADPIEYVLNRLKYDIEIEKFDILNALAELDKIKNNKPVAYYGGKIKEVLWDKDLDKNKLDSNFMIPLYMDYKQCT